MEYQSSDSVRGCLNNHLSITLVLNSRDVWLMEMCVKQMEVSVIVAVVPAINGQAILVVSARLALNLRTIRISPPEDF